MSEVWFGMYLAGPTSGAAARAALDYATSLPDQGRIALLLRCVRRASVRYLQHPLYESCIARPKSRWQVRRMQMKSEKHHEYETKK